MSDLSNFSLWELFSLEVENQTTVLNENLLILEEFLRQVNRKDLTEISSQLENLMRAAHSIKGAAKIVRIETAVRIAHIMEDCFVGTINKTITLTNDQLDSLFNSIDILQQIGQNKDSEIDSWLIKNQTVISETMAKIGRILGRRQSDQEPPPTPIVVT